MKSREQSTKGTCFLLGIPCLPSSLLAPLRMVTEQEEIHLWSNQSSLLLTCHSERLSPGPGQTQQELGGDCAIIQPC